MVGAKIGGGPRSAIQEESSSSEEGSSDWDDWRDPEYIEEQRAALKDFSQ